MAENTTKDKDVTSQESVDTTAASEVSTSATEVAESTAASEQTDEAGADAATGADVAIEAAPTTATEVAPVAGASAESSDDDDDDDDESNDGEVAAEEDGIAGVGELPKPKNTNPKLRWFVVHTYSGYEKKAKKSLQEAIRRAESEAFFGDLEEEILIPVEEIVELKKGEKKTSERKLFPGYMLVRMELTDETWHLIKTTPKITGFVGNSARPVPISELEVRKITRQMEEGVQRPKPKIEFEQGEEVQVIDGPFMNFNGVVEEVKPEKGKVRVMVSIFGRRTPVELDFMQIEKI